MKKAAFLAIVALLLWLPARPANAWGHGWGWWHGGGWGGPRVVIGVGPVWAPGYAGWYYPPPPYYAYPAPSVVVQQPPVYVEQQPPAPAPPAHAYWYYCPSAGGYYPNVRTCPEQWVPVAPTPE